MKKLASAALVAALVLATGCSRHGLSIYVEPPTVAPQTVGAKSIKGAPLDVRISVTYFHNGEEQPDEDTTYPFKNYASAKVHEMGAFNVVSDESAPELKFTLTSTVDNDVAFEQGLKSAASVGFADAFFKRDFELTAELVGVGKLPARAGHKQFFTVSTRKKNAPQGTTPLGLRDGYEAIYSALLYPTMDQLMSQLQ